MADYWYNINTGQVEDGASSSWKHLLGPYRSHAEAARALDRVQENNASWDEKHGDDAGSDADTT